MKRKLVSSTSITSVGYDAAQRILEIEFNNDSIYQYFEVPEEIYQGLLTAPSHGQYFEREIRNAEYEYERVD